MFLLTIISGNGRGKTSNIVGRILSHCHNKKSILVIQFMKNEIKGGERYFFNSLPNVTWLTLGLPEFYMPTKNHEKYQRFLKEGIKSIVSKFNLSNFEIIFCDELLVALSTNLLLWKDVECLFSASKLEEIVLTGRIVKDLTFLSNYTKVELHEINHPYQLGVKARKGIDF